MDTSFRPVVPRVGPTRPSAGDLREPHGSVFVERAIGRLGDAEGRDAILGGAWTRGFAAGDRDERGEFGSIGRLEAHEEVFPRRPGWRGNARLDGAHRCLRAEARR